MKTLTLGFFYVTGLSWALAETCVIASNGNWLPLTIFLILFVLMFSILGCVRISDRMVEVFGGIFALLLAVGLVFLTVQTALSGAIALAAIKAIFSLGFVAVGALSMGQSLKSGHAH